MISIDLKKIQFFSNLSSNSIAFLQNEFKTQSFKKGHVFFEEGTLAKGLYVLLEGEVGLYKRINDDNHRLHVVKPGELFGEFTLITGGKYDDFSKAEKNCKVLFLEKTVFEKVIAKDKQAGLAISISLSRKLHELRQRIAHEKNKTTVAVIYNEGNTRDKSWLALQVAISLKEQTKKKVLLIDLLTNPQDIEAILHQKFNYEYILINLPQYKDSVSSGIIVQADYLLNLSDQDVSLYKKIYKHEMRIVSVDLARERQMNRLDWYIGHLARVISKSTVGLALGSGTVGGLAHIGVLKYLQEKKIPIDMIAGCSGGALYGALWATSGDYKKVYGIVKEQARKKFISSLDFAWNKTGLAKGEKIRSVFNKVFGQSGNFASLKIPLLVVATNLTEQKLVVFESGSLWDALRASISLPIVFVPHRIGNKYYVDGNVTEPLPVKSLKERGMDKVIAVYASQNRIMMPKHSKNFIDVYLQSRAITNDYLAKEAARIADVFINPDVSDYGIFEYDRINELVKVGYQTARLLLGASRK